MQLSENLPQELSLKDCLEVLRRRRWAILETFGLVVAAGTLATAIATPIFRAEAKLLVRATPSYADLNSLDPQNPLIDLLALTQPESVETQIAVLQSDPFLERVLRKASVGPQTPGAPQIQSTHLQDTNIISVAVESSDPELAKRVANTMAGEYLDYTREMSLAEVKAARGFVEKEHAKAERALDQAERDLLAFRRGSGVAQLPAEQESRTRELVDLETRSRENANAVARVTAQIEELKAQFEREPAIRRLPTGRQNPAREALEARLADLEAQREALLSRYREHTPQVTAVAAQIARVEQRLRAQPAEQVTVRTDANPEREALRTRFMDLHRDLRGLEAERPRLAAALTSKRAHINQLGPWEIRLGQLTRVRDAAQKSFFMLDEKLQDLRIRENARRSDARIMEPAALPTAPVQPRKSVNLLLASAMGIILGLSVAFLQEYLDDRLTTSEGVERSLGLPVLGHVPMIPAQRGLLMTVLPAYGPIAESYRALRASIGFAGVDQPLRTLVVSSAEKGEGKSVTAMNLAIAMALEGRRVVLVDTDLRHPTVHRLLGWEMTPGLTELLVGAAPLEAVLREHPAAAGLKVITSGAMPPNPAELVNSAPMAELIQRLTDQAETVIFDCPPVLPVTDAVLLSAKVDGVLLVADISQARRAGLKNTKEQFARARARLVGLVFNKVTAKDRVYHGYYNRGYYEEDRPEIGNGASNGHRNGRVHGGDGHRGRALTLRAGKSEEPGDE